MRLSIRWKLVLFLIVPVMVVYASLTIYNALEIRRWTTQSVERQMTVTSQSYAQHFDGRLREAALLAASTATLVENNPLLTLDQIYDELQANLELNPLVYASAVCFRPNQSDPDRRMLYVHRAGNEFRRVDPSLTGYDYTGANREYWHFPKNTGKSIWTEPYYDEGAGDILMCTYSVPFFHDGQFNGIATVDIPLEQLGEVAGIDMPSDCSFSVMTGTGRVVYSPSPERINKSILELLGADGNQPLIDLAGAIVSGEAGSATVSGWTSDEPEWVFFNPVESAGWGFALSTGEQAAMAPVREQFNRDLITLAVALVVMFAGLWFLSSVIASPISRLTAAVEEVGSGNLDTRVRGTSSDEIGVLASSFNDMANRLAERERALRESEHNLLDAQYMSRMGGFTWDISTGGATWSDGLYRLLKYDKSQKIDYEKVNTDIHHPDDLERVTKWLMDSISSGEEIVPPNEYRLVCKDGSVIDVHTEGRIEYENGKAVKLFGICQDITERKRTEDALHKEKAFGDASVASLPGIFYVYDEQGNFLRWNHNLETVSGYSGDEIARMHPEEFFPPDERERVKKAIGEVFTKGWAVVEADFLPKDGRRTPYLLTGARFETNGRPCLAGMGLDITDRKKAEKDVEASRSFLDTVVDMSPFAMWVSDARGTMIRSNHSLRRTLNVTDEMLIGKYNVLKDENITRQGLMPEVAAVFEKHRPASFTLQWNAAEAGADDLIEAEDLYVSVSLFPILNAEGVLTNVVCQWVDTTRLKHADEERQAHVHFLESLDRVNRAIQQADDVERMLWNVVETTFSIFGCDRAWLLCPLDPEAPTFRIPIEVTRPEYPGGFAMDSDLPMDPGAAKIISIVLGADGPLTFGTDGDHPIYGAASDESYSVQSQLVMGVYPRTGEPWMFGMHSCSHARVWTESERSLFGAIGRRVADALSTLLIHRDLSESEERYRATVEQTGQMVYDYDPSTGHIRWLGATEKMTGYSVEEFSTVDVDRWGEMIHPEDREEMLSTLADSQSCCGLFNVTYRFRHRNGQYIHIEEHGIFLPDEEGQAYRMLGTMSDVTERKRAEEALEKRLIALTQPLEDAESVAFDDLFNLGDIQRLQDEFASATGVASMITHTDGTPITRPSQFCRLCQDIIRQTPKGRTNCYKSDAALGCLNLKGPNIETCMSSGLWDAGAAISVGGKHIANWLIGQVRDKSQTEDGMRAYACEIEADEEAVVEAFREVPAMSREQFEQIAQALYTLANQLSTSAYQNVQQARFITERKQAEEALQVEKDSAQRYLDMAGAMLVALDSEGKIELLNSKACEILGCTVEEALGRDWFGTFLPERFRTDVTAVFRQLMFGEVEPVEYFENPILTSNGEERMIAWHNTTLTDAEGNHSGILSSGEDITDRILRENISRVQRDLAVSLNTVSDLEEGLTLCLNAAMGVSGFECGGMYLVDRKAGHVDLVHSHGLSPEFTQTGAHYDAGSPNATLITSGEPVYLGGEELQTVMDGPQRDEQLTAVAILPIAFAGEVIACMNVASHMQREIPEATRNLLEGIAAELGGAIRRLRVVEELSQSEEKFSSAFQSGAALMAVSTVEDGQFVDINNEFLRVLGYRKHEVIGRTSAELNLYWDVNQRDRVAGAMGKPGAIRDIEILVRTKSGEKRHSVFSAERIRVGTDEFLFTVMNDVTDRKLAEEALKENETKYRQLVEQSIQGMAIAQDNPVRLSFASKPMQSILGYTPEELTSFTPEQLAKLVHPEDREAFFESLRNRLAGNEVPARSEYRVIHESGSTRFVDIFSSVVEYNGTPASQAVFLDITDRKLYESERESLITELETKNTEMERFTYAVSHDLKSPLITIAGFLSILRKDAVEGDTERVDKDIERIESAAGRMRELLDDLLQMSRIGRVVNASESVCLSSLAETAAELVSGRSAEKGIEIDISPEMPTVFGDRSRLLEVLQNLVENSVKYMGTQTRPHIEIGTRRDGEWTVCYVRDNGIGIDPRYQNRVFNIFEQLEPRSDGTGIGLALVKRIVETHNGQIWVESSGVGKGTTFCFVLPENDPSLLVEEG